MTFPSSDVNTTNADAGTDSPATFRTDMLDLLTKFNQLRNHIPTFAQTLISRTTAALMRTDLGAAASGSNGDITALTALASVPTVVSTYVDANGVKPGIISAFAGASAPAGYLVCPTAPATVSRTTYAALRAAIGDTWGAGDGSTTFGIPWFPADYAMVQASGNVGTQTVGQVIAHSHGIAITAPLDRSGGYYPVPGAGTSAYSDSTGGAANLAAGVRTLICVKY